MHRCQDVNVVLQAINETAEEDGRNEKRKETVSGIAKIKIK